MLTNVTFSLPEETIRRLRQKAKHVGRKKGIISQMVDKAIRKYLDSSESASRGPLFTALRGDRPLGQAASLAELADLLRSKGVDPRTVRIVSSEPLEPVGRLGLRVRSR